MKQFMFAIFGLLPLLGGCQRRIRPDDLGRIRIGMSKEEVIEKIGRPSVYRGSMINNYNQLIEVLEYIVDMGHTSKEWSNFITLAFSPLHDYASFALIDHSEIYWLFFCNDFLSKWCRAGDWETAQHQIQEIRFR